MKREPKNCATWSSGDVFAILLEDGRYSAVRVLTPGQQGARWSEVPVVGVTKYIGSALPRIDDPLLRKATKAIGPSGRRELFVTWLGKRPPSTVRFVGNLPLSVSESSPKCIVLSFWPVLAKRILLEWRRVHDPEALARAEAIEHREQKRMMLEARRAEKARFANLSLDSLRRSTPFASWRGNVKPRLVKAANDIHASAVNALIELGPNPPTASARLVLRQYIDAFNALDSQSGQFIETNEREMIIEALRDLTIALRLPKLISVEQYRDW